MRRSPRWQFGRWFDALTLRLVTVTAVALVLGVFAGKIFDRFEPSILIAPAIVGGAATLVRPRGRPIWFVAVVAGAVAGVVSTVLVAGGSIGDLFGLVDGPRRLLSTEWPSPRDPVMLGTLGALLAAGTSVAGCLVVRRGSHLAPLSPLLGAMVVVVALAAPQRPSWLLLGALAVLAVGFVVVRPGPGGESSAGARTVHADRTVVMSVGAIAIAAVAVATSIGWPDRADPRRIEAPDTSLTLLDPIEATVGLRGVDPPLALFEIIDRSGEANETLPDRWRLTALEDYDGQRWVPRLTLRPIGERLGDAPVNFPSVVVDARILTDDFDLVPFPGQPISIDARVETDVDRVVVRLTERPGPGTTVRFSALVAPTSLEAGPVATRQVDEIAGTFTESASLMAGDGGIADRLAEIARVMRSEWQLDAQAPGGGQQLALIERFVNDTRRGTHEQFVTAYVLLVRSLGVDARVATGFALAPDATVSPVRLDSSAAAVWPEVRLDGVGWVAVDPVPESESVVDEEPVPPPQAQSPAAAQPPLAPPAENDDDVEIEAVAPDAVGGRFALIRRWLKRVGVMTAIGLLPFVAVAAALLGWKWRRRSSRLGVGRPASIVRGAWANTTDSLVDAGLRIESSWTDDTIATHASSVAATMPHEARRLAAMATAMTFGPTDDATLLVDDALAIAAAVDEAIRSSRSLRQRIAWRLSLRSIRPATRSPVRC